MRQSIKLAAAFVAGTVIAGGGAIAVTSASDNTVHACVNSKTRAITLAPASGTCPTGTKALDWSIQGPQGQTGPQGAQGPKGDTGARGATGTSGGTSFLPEVLAKDALPSVVTISTSFRCRDAWGRTVTDEGTGTGWFAAFPSRKGDGNSYLITNNHVVVDPSCTTNSITVELNDGTQEVGTIVGNDPVYDVAVVQVPHAGLPTLAIGDANTLTIGEPVLAIGAPLALPGTVTTGIISALHRPVITTGNTSASASDPNSYINAIQTDAAINPGNSGGPLFDAGGNVIGMNAAIATLGGSSSSPTGSIGLGFAIPVNSAYRVANELVTTATFKDGKVTGLGTATRPMVGVSFDKRFTGVGAKVSDVDVAGAAGKAGVPVGAVVRKVDSQIVKDYLEAVAALRSYAPGATVSVTVDLPTGGSRTYSVTLGSAPSVS